MFFFQKERYFLKDRIKQLILDINLEMEQYHFP